MTEKGYISDLYKQLEEVINKCDNLSRQAKDLEKKHKLEIAKLKEEHKKEISTLKNEVKTLKKENEKLKKENEKLKKENIQLKTEILKLKHKNNKDSSNSSKPSSTNGYKKVITNRREKSDKKRGGQLGHTGNCLSEENIKKIKASGKYKIEKHEINKNDNNKNSKPIIRKVIDIEIVTVIHEYWYYPDENGKYNIPSIHMPKIQYGSNIKALALDMMYEIYTSTDGVSTFISRITNDCINLSKGTLINWAINLNNKIQPELENIEKKLLSSYYLNCDDSQIKIDGDNYNNICSCNDKYSRFWINKKRSKEALEEIGFLNRFFGVIVKDGTDVYNGYGIKLSQCISHIQRYIKAIIDGNNHEGAKKMKKFFTTYNNLRNKLLLENKAKFSCEEYKNIIKEYEEILSFWKKEWMKSSPETNIVYDEERKLLTRLEENDKDQILYFLTDFKVPSTNNQAETDQRNIKIKQKIGKFRSEFGAKIYANVRSCINTYKKNNINIFSSLKEALDDNLVII